MKLTPRQLIAQVAVNSTETYEEAVEFVAKRLYIISTLIVPSINKEELFEAAVERAEKIILEYVDYLQSLPEYHIQSSSLN